jgi:hypothetical protein
MSSLLGGALLAVLVAVSPAAARDQLGQRDEVVVDPQRAYIFYRSSERLDLRFMKEVDAAELSAWQAERAEAFERARSRAERRIAAWDRMTPDCRGNGRNTPQCQGRGDRPEPVTNENFAFPAPEQDNFVTVMGGRQFTRGDGDNSYFIAVEPGSYVLYGQLTGLPQGPAVGTCLCMGSVRFEARAGEIVDLGTIRYPRIEADAARDDARWYGPDRLSTLQLMPPTPSLAVPDRLAGRPLVRASFRAADKMPNYFGVTIDRLPAIPGVLGYDRDRVIDEAAGTAVASAR